MASGLQCLLRRWHRGNMSLLRWIWAYLFDCVHPHTTWPHQNQFGLAYVCCLDCGREMPYSLEYMQIVRQTGVPVESVAVRRILAGVILLGAILAFQEKANATGLPSAVNSLAQASCEVDLLGRMCFSSIILSPPNGNVKMSPHERKDIRVESEGTATSERNFQLR